MPELRTAVYVSNLARIGAKICQNAFRTIPEISFFDAEKFFFAKFSDRKNYFSQILRGFGRRTAKWTSPSARASNFALDALILRSVWPKFHSIRSRTVHQHMSSVGTRTCLDWNTRDVLVRTQEISWFEHRKSLDSITRNLLIRTHEIFWFEHRKSSDSNTGNLLIRTQEIFWFEHRY